MMRIAILADPIDNQSAGVHVYTKNLVESLIRYNNRHQYIIIKSKTHPRIEGAQNVVVPDVTGLATIRLFLVIPWIIRSMRIDCVIEPAHFGPFNLPFTIKRITFIHDLTPLLFPHYHPYHSRMLQRLFLPRILRNASYIITNSHYTENDIHIRFPAVQDKVVVNHLGIDPIFGPMQSSDVLSKYRITQPYFLFVGTIEPRKNLEVLLDAFAMFKERIDDRFQLVIVGEKGWKTKTFFERLHRHPYRPDIILTGYVRREILPVLYSMAFTFIYPSRYEGFGLPVLEAMACETPCITSRTASLPEVGGDAVSYFTPGASEELYERMKDLYDHEDLKQRLIREGKQQAKQFTWEKHANRFNRLFTEIEEAASLNRTASA